MNKRMNNREGITTGIAHFASCMYAALYKTASNVDITHKKNIGITSGGTYPIATRCLVHFPNTREYSQHKWST